MQDFTQIISTLHLTSSRLCIRRFNQQDLALQIEHETNPDIMRYIADIVDINATTEKINNLIAPWSGKEGDWAGFAVTLKDESDAMGMVCFRFDSFEFMRVEVGYRFHPQYQGKGYCLEAMRAFMSFLFYQLNVRKASAYCVDANAASEHMMKKLGMQKEAVLRAHSTLGGIWYDELVYGVFKQEFEQSLL